ncbi:hypothetical protein G4Y79_18335 [Phototrophicus methaneseepsis]|uniref:Uncharacterized protein n=1 Tax=Phototrophicus methaneseepsis TaxID=2710758 RepID=A0A7S8E781_9CHLR|nr:hypothetical protein [Phototrophicus methaneseepsis]QPC81632.1 hypothetical protein G4Y79_18335 [Phototrophicus methaneseepsis]
MTSVFIGSGILLVILLRSVLVVIGLYKDPILSSFEKYGEESVYSPMMALIIWAFIFLSYHLIIFVESSLLKIVIVVVSLVIFHTLFTNRDLLRQYNTVFRLFPRWYAQLSQRTSREERRRIAYLWLRLPLRTRLLYNTNDFYFNQWADLVLLSVAN